MLTITESFGGYLRAGLTGLGGAFTGGGISAYYDANKERAALQAAALRNGNPYDMYNADNTGGQYFKTLAGSIPIVGAISNMMAYSDRMDAEKKARLEGRWGFANNRPEYE